MTGRERAGLARTSTRRPDVHCKCSSGPKGSARVPRRCLLGGCGCGMLVQSPQPAQPSLYQQYFAKNMLLFTSDYDRLIGPVKADLFAQLFSAGDVPDLVEVRDWRPQLGVGTGANFAYMAQQNGLTDVTAVDPNPAMFPYARDALAAAYSAQAAPRVSFLTGRAEALPLESSSASAVVSTLVLCSVADPVAALSEVSRVLRPGGAFMFLEHVAAAPGRPLLRLAQQVLDPLQQALADNCHLTRDLTALQLHAYGLTLGYQRRFDVPGLGLIGPHVAGLAVRVGG